MLSALRAAALVAVTALAGCSGIGKTTVPDELPPMGEFRLGHNIVVTDNVQKVPISRDATKEELETAMKAALQERFGRYEGRKYYHIGVNIDAYALAPPGIPIVVSPKSVLVVSANIWDDRLGKKVHEKPQQFTVFENLTGATVIGSGLTQSKEVQLENLTKNAAKMIHDWMLENPEWFAVTAEESARLDAEAATREAAAAKAAGKPPAKGKPN